MSKEIIYNNIQKFNDKHTDSSDTSSKTFREAYLYVSDEEAVDKAEFVKYLILQGYISSEYSDVIDLTFGSGNLTSHIIFDNEIDYSTITLNDINTKKTNQKLSSIIENCTITQNDILDDTVFEGISFDLVIVNPQIGGSYTYGDILKQKENGEKNEDILYKLTFTLDKFYESGSTIIFYGKEKDFNSLFEDEKFYQYKSDTQNLFIIKNNIEKTLCFGKDEDGFIEKDCQEEKTTSDIIESFDDVSLITEEYAVDKNIQIYNNEQVFKEWWYNSKQLNQDGKEFDQKTKNAYFNGIKRLNKDFTEFNIFSINSLEKIEELLVELTEGSLKDLNRKYGYNASNGLKQYINFLMKSTEYEVTDIDKKVKNVAEKIKLSNEKIGNLNFPHKNILFKGVPGTGKSKTVDNIIKDKLEMQELSTNILRINIHSASSNSDLMQGISISTDENQNILYKEKRGSVLKHIIKAIYRPFQPFVLVLEEIQENSLNELIGDLIYLIEDTKRTKVKLDEQTLSYDELIELVKPLHFVELPSLVENSDTNTKMIIPDNLYIFCTSNYRDDKKVIEDNLLRRFDVIEMYPKNQEELGKEDKEFIFKSKEVSDFLEKLNKEILTAFKEETHPDRNIIGHANWLKITDEESNENRQLFYKALLKVVIEFKEIREVEFEFFVQPIFSEVFKKENGLSATIEKYLEIFYTEDILTLSTYKEMVEKLQKEIYSSFI